MKGEKCLSCEEPLIDGVNWDEHESYSCNICDKCFENYYGFCDQCGRIFRYYEEMNDGKVGVSCKECLAEYKEAEKSKQATENKIKERIMANKKSILQRLANTLAERMTWERNDGEEWSQFIKDIIQCVLQPSGIHLTKWVRNGEHIDVLLDDLVNGGYVWSNHEEENG